MATVSQDELYYWEAIWSLEPWGEPMEWLRIGELMALIFNRSRSAKEKAASPLDFLPDFLKPSSERPPQ